MTPGTTLVIVGNGPSLRGFDFARIANVDCIGMNAAYRFWHETGWYPRYYICLDLVVGLSHKDAIADLIRTSKSNGIELFFLRQNLIQALPEDVQTSESVVDFDAWVKNAPVLAINPLTTGSHSALIGALLGYDRLILLGIDCDYVEQVSGAKLDGRALEIATTPESNPNYFFDGYQVAGDRYNVPNPQPDLHIRSWRAVAPYLKDTGVRVWNCNPVSLVDAFDFRRFEDIEDTLGERLPRPAAPGLPHGRKTGPAHVGAATDLGRAGRGLRPWRQAIAAGIGLLLLVLPFVLSTVFAAPAWVLVTANTFLIVVLLAGLGFELRRAIRFATGNTSDIRDEGATPDMRASAAFSKASVLAKELRSLEERLDTQDICEDSDDRPENGRVNRD
ncbi:MAG: hypothetical protein H6886_08165 [Hyphomicrobiaceae bacterium]|nr:hypothetical protein [Hyphomicrobiaceae bacterium]